MQTLSKAVLLITGAWHVPQHYDKLIKQLQTRQCRVICERLPTNNNAVPPNTTIDDDVAFIGNIVEQEASAGTYLTVLAHSYGGVVASAALADFAATPGHGKGGVTDIIMMAAFIPSENTSLAGIFGGILPPYLTSQPNGTITWSDPASLIYNDMTEEDAQWAEKQMVAHGHAAQYTPISCSKVAWRIIPLSYIICDDDKALPNFVQEMMIKNVEEQGFSVSKFRLPASHSPFLSMPERVADIVINIMGR